MASSALDVQLTMVKVMQALRVSDESITPPIELISDNHINDLGKKQKKSVSYAKESPVDNKLPISASQPATSTFTPPVEIGSKSLCHSTQNTPFAPTPFVGTAPEVVRLKSEKDLNKATAAQKNTASQIAPICSIQFRKVSLKGNCVDVGGQKVDQQDLLVQSANDSKVEIKRSVGF